MARIFCFTSTGNSLSVANRIACTIEGTVSPMNTGEESCNDGVIGFVFPVFFWGLPRIVQRFIAQLQIADKNAYVFAVITSGGPQFGSLGLLKRLLGQKGICLSYGAYLQSVTNYTPEYKPKDSEELRAKREQRITKIAGEIANKQLKQPYAPTFFNEWFYRHCPDERSDQFFTVSPACTSCGVCEDICPVNNIAIVDGRLSFKHTCEHCLACLHCCPVCAIDWKQKTQGKDRYRNAALSLADLIAFNKGETDGG